MAIQSDKSVAEMYRNNVFQPAEDERVQRNIILNRYNHNPNSEVGEPDYYNNQSQPEVLEQNMQRLSVQDDFASEPNRYMNYNNFNHSRNQQVYQGNNHEYHGHNFQSHQQFHQNTFIPHQQMQHQRQQYQQEQFRHINLSHSQIYSSNSSQQGKFANNKANYMNASHQQQQQQYKAASAVSIDSGDGSGGTKTRAKKLSRAQKRYEAESADPFAEFIYVVQFKRDFRGYTPHKNSAQQQYRVGDVVLTNTHQGDDIGLVTDIMTPSQLAEKRRLADLKVTAAGVAPSDECYMGHIMRLATTAQRQQQALLRVEEQEVMKVRANAEI